ncbi:TPA: hypothetical protein MHQ31_07910 [Klebsiella pneumoniae]|nr:hypothetical protein [Klebsiella pneumoniae]
MYEFDLVLLLLQQMCVFLVIAWLMSKTRLFIPLMQVTVRLPHKLLCYVTFSIFCIMGTYFGLHIEDSIANTRAIGAVMGGLLGGPVVGGLVGLTGGLHRYSLGGMTALSCMVSTIVEGLLGGLVHSVLVNRTLGEGIAQLLSAQILAGQYERQKALLTQSEIKLLHAQVNPHFLFNALNTLKAVIRRDSDQAGQLVQYLSTFFRKNLKRPTEIVTLADEIEHVNAYLQIEKARFQANLQIQMAVPEGLAHHQLPAFTLQPIVENAIKHGTSQHLGVGEITIRASQDDRWLQLDIEDNAGLYRANPQASGLGMNLVDRRLRARFGADCGISVTCEPERFTRVTLRLPLEENAC